MRLLYRKRKYIKVSVTFLYDYIIKRATFLPSH